MEPLHRELGLADPFIVENGGGIAFPEDSPIAGALASLLTASKVMLRGEFFIHALGTRY